MVTLFSLERRLLGASSGKHIHLSISLPPLLHLGSGIGKALLPQDCLLCQAASGRELLCAACARELPIANDACPRCAAAGNSGAVCGACLAQEPYYDASRAAFDYAYPVDALIRSLKYGAQLALAELFARALQRRIGPVRGVDLIVPLPLHPARLAERGFNQAAEIAKFLSRHYAIPIDTRLATRVRNTAPQTGMPWRERQTNMRRAFACKRGIAGLSIAVVDDVMTTGATLNEFARTLKRSGATRVENWVIARTLHGV